MKIFVSAAEISSDLQAEKIIRSLLLQLPKTTQVKIYGIGGPKLRELPGFKALKNAEDLRAMGFVEVLSKLKFIRETLAEVISVLKRDPPDLIMTFDYPDFHFQLLKKIYADVRFENTLKICGIPPKVWVWRSKRVEKIRKYFDGVWVILPFEKKFYEDHGISVIYEGNPLISDLLEKGLGLPKLSQADTFHLAVMPGSREGELKYHLPIIPETLERIAKKLNKRVFAQVPVPDGLPVSRFKNFLTDSDRVKYEFVTTGSVEVLAKNPLGLIKSGTSTLEAAVLGCAPIIFYKANFFSEWLFRLVVRYTGPVGLPNILLNIKKREDSIFPEYLGHFASAEALSNEVISLTQDRTRLENLQLAGKSLRDELVPSGQVAEKVAARIHEWIKIRPPKDPHRKSRIFIFFISFLWSTINLFRRWLVRIGFMHTQFIETPSVLVGNLQAGGAGKTPLVIELAREAEKRGFRVGVISRGYGRKSKEILLLLHSDKTNNSTSLNASQLGDEPMEILNSVPGVALGIGSDRALLAKKLSESGCNFLIFDDGFQNLKFKASFTLLAVTDATPSELIFRDFDSAYVYADTVIQTKGLKIPRNIRPRFRVEWSTEQLPRTPIWLFCALGDPGEVAQFYRNLGVRIDKVITKSDHAVLSTVEVKNLMDDASRAGATLAVTEKDRVKLPNDGFSTLFVLRRRIANSDWSDFIFEHLQCSLQDVKLS